MSSWACVEPVRWEKRKVDTWASRHDKYAILRGVAVATPSDYFTLTFVADACH
jgi:hypothetical protein